MKWLRHLLTAEISDQQKARIMPYVLVAMILAFLLGYYLFGPAYER